MSLRGFRVNIERNFFLFESTTGFCNIGSYVLIGPEDELDGPIAFTGTADSVSFMIRLVIDD